MRASIVAVFSGFLSLVLSLSAQTLTTLHSFDGKDGSSPWRGWSRPPMGISTGRPTAVAHGCGTVFKITPTGTLDVAAHFQKKDGCYPYAGLVQATNGGLYGTTVAGTACNYGTVFKVTQSGKLMTLHSFCGEDGAYPYAGLVQDAAGNLYGTTEMGGSYDYYGTVFKITPSGTVTTLYSFENGTDGANPYAEVVQATDGTSTGRPKAAGPTALARSSKSPQAAPSRCFTPSARKAVARTEEVPTRAGPSHRWEPLRDNRRRQRLQRRWHGSSKSPQAAPSRCFTPSARKAVARTEEVPTRGWSKPPMGTSTGRPISAGPTASQTAAVARSSKSPQGQADDAAQLRRTDGADPYAGLVQYTDGNLYGTTAAGGSYDDGNGLQPVCGSGAVCGNPADLRQGGDSGQDTWNGSDRREPCHL